MRFWRPHFRPGFRRLTDGVCTLWRSLVPRRDDAGEPGDLDRVWRAECEEMDAILRRKDPGSAQISGVIVQQAEHLHEKT